jgi:hypothetical protein
VWLSVVGGIVGRNSLLLVLGMEILFAPIVGGRVFDMPSHLIMVMAAAGAYLAHHWYVTPATVQKIIRNDPCAGIVLSIEEEIAPSLDILVDWGYLVMEKGTEDSVWNKYKRFIPDFVKGKGNSEDQQ